MLALSLAYAYACAFHDGIVLAIEEPESHLHPLAQQWLAQRLRQLASDGLQLVITTHSAHFLDLTALPGLVLVKKNGGCTTVVQRTAPEIVSECVATGAPSERTTEENILSFYAASAVPEILEGFFARAVILVEGPTESLTMPILMRRMGFDHARSGVAVIPVGGKGNLGKWKRLFEAYAIPTYLVFDNDSRNDPGGARRLDALAAMTIPENRRLALVASTDWIIEDRFSVFGGNFESTMRQNFATYAALEAAAKAQGVESKPFTGRWVAERLPLDENTDGCRRLSHLVDMIRRWCLSETVTDA